MTSFQYDSEILSRFPNIVGGVILASGMQNGPTPDGLLEAFRAEQKAVLKRIGDTPLSELPSLAAWRRAFSQFGVKPTQYRSACEALLRRLTKQGDIPSINTLVDIGNLVSIRYALPVAMVDTRAIQGTVTVHFADGSERYTELGADGIMHPEPGEVIFSDETKMVVARRWCWRQSAESAAQEDTTNAIITFEAQHEGGHQTVEQAGADLLALLKEYAGGGYRLAVLDKAQSGV
jgi:DNA/RNA-binding domain of Phe-tRNA-synthetase-like protein